MKERLDEFMENCSIVEFFIIVILAILIVIGLICLDVAIATYIWNVVVVSIFGVSRISFWKMLGLIWLFKIFTGKLRIDSKKEEE